MPDRLPKLEFVDAPPPRNANRPSKYAKIVDALKENPGKWAVIQEFDAPGGASSLVSQVKKGQGAWAGHPIKAVSRSEDGKTKVYAIYGDDQ